MSRVKSQRNARTQGLKRVNQPAQPKEKSLAGPGIWAVLAGLLAAVTIVLYIPVFGHSFLVLDDQDYVTANPHVHDGLSWATIKWAFTSIEAANWHPLTWLSHALDYQLFALNPAWHHFDSVLIHALNAALLFLLLAWLTRRAGPSLVVAALFAVHPINVESVAWIAERKNVLSTLFFILAIGAYAWYAKRPSPWRYLLQAGLFAAGLMAKPMVITLPLVLMLMDYWPLRRTPLNEAGGGPADPNSAPQQSYARLLMEKIPLLFLSAASAWVTLVAQRPAKRTFAELPLAMRIGNALVSYAMYLQKMIWPARLSFYPHAVSAPPAWQWILSALVLAGVTALVIRFRGKGYLPVGWLWFLITLIPVIGVVQVGEFAMADRYAYIPLIGIFIMIAWGLADLAQAKRIGAAWVATSAVCVLALLAAFTYRQMQFWASDYDLWANTLETAEDPMTYNALGMALMRPELEMTPQDQESFGTEQSRIDQSRKYFERALELRQPQAEHYPNAYLPDVARTLTNLGNLDRLQNRPDGARLHSERSLQIYRQLAQESPEEYRPFLAATLVNVGGLDRLQSLPDEASQHDGEALQIYRELAAQNPPKYLPNVALLLNEFGYLDASQNRMDDARQHYGEALTIDRQLAAQSPSVYLYSLAVTLTNFGLLDVFQKRLDDARLHYEEALKIDRQLAQQNPSTYLPDMAMTLSNLGRVDELQNQIADSSAHYTEAATVYRRLAQSDPARYRGAMARVEASLNELNQATPSR